MLGHGSEPATCCKEVLTVNQLHLTHAFSKKKHMKSMTMFIPLLYFKIKLLNLPNALGLSIHHVNNYTGDVHTLSNPVYSFSGKEKVGKGKQKVKQWKQKISKISTFIFPF